MNAFNVLTEEAVDEARERVILVLTDEHLMHILQEISGICFLIFNAKILKN